MEKKSTSRVCNFLVTIDPGPRDPDSRCNSKSNRKNRHSKTRATLGVLVLRFWLYFRSGFRFLCQKTPVFRFWCSLRFADLSLFSIWFSVLVKNTSGFSVLVSDVVFGFSYFVVFGSSFSSI